MEIQDARDTYDALSPSEKTFVPAETLQYLIDAEAALKAAEDELDDLIKAKETAEANLNFYFNSKKEADYSAEDYASMTTIKNNAIAAIGEAETKAAIQVVVAIAKASLDAFKTTKQKEQEAAEQKEQEAREGIDEAVAELKKFYEEQYPEGMEEFWAGVAENQKYYDEDDLEAVRNTQDYFESQMELLNSFDDNATAYEKAAVLSSVLLAMRMLSADMETAYQNAMNNKDVEEMTLQMAKDVAVQRIEAMIGFRGEEAYRPEDRDIILAAKETAFDAIDEAETFEEIDAACEAAEAIIKPIKTDVEKSKEEADEQAAKDATEAVTKAAEDAEAAKQAADEADKALAEDTFAKEEDKAAVKAAIADLETAVAALETLDDESTSEEKAAAAKAVEDAIAALDKAVDTAKSNASTAKAADEAAKKAEADKQAAVEKAKKETEEAVKNVPPVAGTVIYDAKSKAIYKVLIPSAKGKVGTVEYKRPDGSPKKANIPETITVNNFKYDVTAIGAGAFEDCAKLKSVTVPAKVTVIGAKAFFGCGKLKIITVKSTVLKKVGKKALGKINKKAKIKVPKAQKKAYKKLFKKKGQPKSVKIK
ncbi:MAG: leucine-rich repeat domain-containing protein [Eubacterium sp.]|nr:leucine-rich repeat domain-containing protein [Eubacterium sp.]